MWKLVCATFFFLLSGSIFAEVDNTLAEQFFSPAKFQSVKVAPNGKHIAFTYEEGNELKLGIIRLKDSQITARFSFGEQMHVVQFHWANNERVLMLVAKITGNLDSHFGRSVQLHGANIDGSQRKRMDEEVRGFNILSLQTEKSDRILISKSAGGSTRAYHFDVYTGKTSRVADQPDEKVSFLMADQTGHIRLAGHAEEGDGYGEVNYQFYVRRGDSWATLPLKVSRKDARITPAGFSPDGKIAYLISNHEDLQSGIQALYGFDYESGTVTRIHRDAVADIDDVVQAQDGSVLGVSTAAGKPVHHWLHEQHPDATLLKGLMASLPDHEVRIASTTSDATQTIIHARSDRQPGRFFLYNRETGSAQLIAETRPQLSGITLQAMEPFSFKARDGMLLHGYLTRAKANSDKNPLIVIVHGGPFGIRHSWGFDSEAQFFAQHGYHVLQVNFRGSGGYGAEFERAGWREFLGKMQDDVTDATHWAINQGITDANKVCIYGGSYGGFATLGGLVKEPDLYRCGVAYVGVYDLLYKATGSGTDSRLYMGSQFVDYVREQVGPDDAFIKARSPILHVDKLKAPIFIVAAEDDVRVPIEHSYRLRDALSERNKAFEWMSKPDEGHGYQKPENRIELYNRMLDFFDTHLKSRR